MIEEGGSWQERSAGLSRLWNATTSLKEGRRRRTRNSIRRRWALAKPLVRRDKEDDGDDDDDLGLVILRTSGVVVRVGGRPDSHVIAG